MRIVALEEHFVVRGLIEAWSRAPGGEGGQVGPAGGELAQRLHDTGDRRVADMDDQGVDVQVLSLSTPGVQNLPREDAGPVAREANDALAAVVSARPDRFQGFAAVPTPDPGAAAAELERAVTRLGFRGALLNGRTGTANMDAPQFGDLYATAERLGAPLYLHPQTPAQPVRDVYYTGIGDPVDRLFAGPGIGWHYETGVQLLRLIFAGVFDRYPRLQVILGHWGEVVLFFLERTTERMEPALHLDRPLADYFRQNVWITGSGVLSHRYLRWAAEVAGAGRLLYATDYPYIDTSGGKARAFLEQAPLTEEEKEAVGSGSWERLTGHLGAAAGAG